MATAAAIQDNLGGINVARIIRSINLDATYDAHYTVGGIGYKGRSHWCRTTLADAAADQATEILTALASQGPLDPNLQ